MSAFIVHDENDLRRVMQLRRSRVEMAVSQFDLHRNRDLEARINRQLGECGCGMSAMFIFFSAGPIIAADVLEWGRIYPRFAATIGLELALVVVLAGVGKCLGIAIARRKLSTIIAGLIAELSVSHCAVAAASNLGDDYGMH